MARMAEEGSVVPVALIRLLLAGDHALLRHGVRALLAEAGGFEITGEAADGRQAVRLAARHRPDIVLMGVEMPGCSALEAMRQMRRAALPSRVLILGTPADEEHLLEYLRAGASGLLLKEATGVELVCALRDVHRAAFYVSSAVSRRVLNRWHRGAVKPRHTRAAGHEAELRGPGDDPLSERERELLACVASGLANRHIAERLCISVKTVEAHKAHMVAKLGLGGTSDLVRFALRRYWPAPAASA